MVTGVTPILLLSFAAKVTSSSTCIILILIAFDEAGGTSSGYIHAMGSALVVGRILHPMGLTNVAGVNPLRFIGTNLTWITLLASSIFVLVNQYS
jgi:hypothetical protein